MSHNLYAIMHKNILQTDKPEDPLTLDPVAPDDILNKCKVISYMVIIDNKLVKILYNTLDFMRGWFLDQQKNKFPQNNMIVPQVFLKRLTLQLEARAFFGEHYNLEPINLAKKFSDYIYRPENISPKILCELKTFLHMDDTGFLSTFVVGNPLELREIAMATINAAPEGSWLIRKASVIDSDVMKGRVITYKNFLGDVCNLLVVHIYSYGYVLPSCKRDITLSNIGEILPSYENDEKQIIKFMTKDTIVYPSFIDCIEAISINNFIKHLLI